MRQSTLGNADACLRRMQYDLETPRTEYHSGSVRAVGTAYHAGLETYYRARLSGGPWGLDRSLLDAWNSFADEVARAGERFLWDEEKFPTADLARERIETMVTTYFEAGHQWPDEFEVLGVEVPFDLPFWGDHVRAGTMDLVLRDPAGFVIGVDHKTAGRAWPKGKEHPRKNNQAPWYTAALIELYPGAPGYRFVFDVMTYAGRFERPISDPDDGHRAATSAKAAMYSGVNSTAEIEPSVPTPT